MRKRWYDRKELRKIRNQALRDRVSWVWRCPNCEDYEVKSGYKKDHGHEYCKTCKKVLISDFEMIEYVEDPVAVVLPTSTLSENIISNEPDDEFKKNLSVALKREAETMKQESSIVSG